MDLKACKTGADVFNMHNLYDKYYHPQSNYLNNINLNRKGKQRLLKEIKKYQLGHARQNNDSHSIFHLNELKERLQNKIERKNLIFSKVKTT